MMSFKLAFKNIKKSIKDYSIYFFTLVVAVSIFYSFNSLDSQTSMLVLSESKKDIVIALVQLINYVSVFVSFVLGFLIIYSNNYLIRRRKNEFGLYLTLGMSKKKVSFILVMETLFVGLFSLIVGLVVGVLLSQFLSIFSASLFEVDLSTYKFVFSNSALIKTIIYFSIIFILVMLFNLFSINKNKIINLLNAKKRNESVKFRSVYSIIISFILSIILLGYAYKLLFNGAMFSFESNIAKMLISGSLGTYFLFFCISGVFLKISEFNKKLYFNNLNMFTFKQINSKANTNVFSTTIICLMLLLTIGILSGALSLVSVFNKDLLSVNVTDFTIEKDDSELYYDGDYHKVNDKDSTLDIANSSFFSKYVSDYAIYHVFNDEVTLKDLVTEKTVNDYSISSNDMMSFDGNVDIISESDFNKILELYDLKDDYIDLMENEYLLTSDIVKAIDFFKERYEEENIITINNKELKPYSKEIKQIALFNSSTNSNLATIIVDDSVLYGLKSSNNFLIGNYKDIGMDIEKQEKEFFSECGYFGNVRFSSKLEIKVSSIGLKAILIFLGLYLGIIFSVASATVLAIKELSESSDNKERFLILKQLGADNKIINRALFVQIAVSFLFPLVIALFHSFFGLRELNKTIELLGNIDITRSISLTSIFIIIVYGGYFIVTYLLSKKIIKND